MNSFRSKNFGLILYPDSLSYDFNDMISYLCDTDSYDYAYILHDCDVDVNGEIKKPHVHFLIRFSSQKDSNTVLKFLNTRGYEFGWREYSFSTHDLEHIHSWEASIRYLIHADYPQKHQYSLKDINSNFDISSFFKDILDPKPKESEKVKIILDYIRYNHVCSIEDLLDFVLSNDLYSYYRRDTKTWFRLLDNNAYHRGVSSCVDNVKQNSISSS